MPLHATTLANLPLVLKVFKIQMDSDIREFQEQYGDLRVIVLEAPRPLTKGDSDWEAILDEYIAESREIG